MNSTLEQGLFTYLKAQLSAGVVTVGAGDAAFSLTAFSSGAQYISLHVNVNNDPLPANLCYVVVAVPTTSQVVPGLYLADIQIVVSTPADDPGIDEILHRTISSRVRACFPDLIHLYQRLATAEGEAEIEAAQSAVDAALLRLQSCSNSLTGYSISDVSPWLLVSTRDGVDTDKKRLVFTMDMRLALLQN